MTATSELGLIQKMHPLAESLSALHRWLDQPRLHPLDDALVEGLAAAISDLEGRVRHLLAEPTLLSVVLVGGTGVGKSSLLNALAGAKIAESSLQRPTTRFPTVYHHRDVSPERLDAILGKCKGAPHDRPELRYKIIIDTPDMDGSVLEHRERLKEVLPVADAVLYVGSQEKYHDREAWKLLLEHRQSRAFAFILNKWDRCLASRREATGRPPDVDFLESLFEAGFEEPVLFRTCANQWATRRVDPAAAVYAEPEDDFLKLEAWIEAGLDERAVRDIKTRGIVGKLDELLTLLDHATPPDWTTRKGRLTQRWDDCLKQAIADQTDALVEAADTQAAALERHFSRLGRANFGGAFGYYLRIVDGLTRFGATILPSLKHHRREKMDELAARAVASISVEARQTRTQALHARLLTLADHEGWPIAALDDFLPQSGASRLDDRTLATALGSQMSVLERELTDPTGTKLATRVAVRALCDWGPLVVGAGLSLKWLWDHFTGSFWGIPSYLAAVIMIGLTFGGLHFLLSRMVPIRWELLRPRFRGMVEEYLLGFVRPGWLKGLDGFAERAGQERRQLVDATSILTRLRDQLRQADQDGAHRSLFAKMSE